MSPTGQRLSEEILISTVKDVESGAAKRVSDHRFIWPDVFIAGSGPIAAAYASTIISEHPTATVYMAEVGSQDSVIPGEHHKNSIKYQKDIDTFVNVVKGALQAVSIPPSDSYLATLGGNGWQPAADQVLVTEGHNPQQKEAVNLPGTGVTRTVGGMATHWTCACPVPHAEEKKNNPIENLDALLEEAKTLLNVHSDQYDHSIRHTVVKETLQKAFPNRGITNLPLGVQRRSDNPDYVTWTGTNTVLKKALESDRFTIATETRVTRLIPDPRDPTGKKIIAAKIRDLGSNSDRFVIARTFVVACGAIGTPQVLFNSDINPPTLGHHLVEQSIAFCQIVLSRSIIDEIPNDPRFKAAVEAHHKKFPNDPLPIPFRDPEPQVMIPYSHDFPWHVQVHRDAFSYGDVGPKADSRTVVDLRFFGKQEIVEDNNVRFGPDPTPTRGWVPGVTDIYGMPQATFNVVRNRVDEERDQRMMLDMTKVANALGPFLPGSNPQFMPPGLALHITGTTRIGKDPKTSVADPDSKVHGFENLWVGGNGCIPDSTACNPTRTSVAIAIRGARSVVAQLKKRV